MVFSFLTNLACKNSFCKVCCDHLPFMFQMTGEKEIMGSLLGLNNEQGLKAIKNILESSTIKRCKRQCNNSYEVELPSTLPRPNRDPDLGKEKKPALSCADIKEWGPYVFIFI